MSLELRAVSSLVRCRPSEDGLAMLEKLYDRFNEGLGTRDLVRARELLGRDA